VIPSLQDTWKGVPNREADSCLDPELPGTGLQERGKRGPVPSVPVKRVSWNPGKHQKKWRRTHSERDEGGSAANRV
jgi:hypothetical protein